MINIIESQHVQTQTTIHFALQHTTHDFGLTKPDGTKGSATRFTNNTSTPRKATSGIYYLECNNCGRLIFSDGTGTASNTACS